MLKLEGLPRVIVSIVVSSSATVVVGNVIAATTPANLTKIQAINVKVGGYAVGVAAGAIVTKHTLEYIDETLETINTIVKTAKAKKP